MIPRGVRFDWTGRGEDGRVKPMRHYPRTRTHENNSVCTLETVLSFAIIGLIPAYIAREKGYSPFALWWLYGACLFPIALFHALFLRDRDDWEREEKRFT